MSQPKRFLTLEEAKEMVASGESIGFEWKYPDDLGNPWLPGHIANPDFDEKRAQSDPRTRVKINGIETTPEIAREAWLLCISPKYRHLA